MDFQVGEYVYLDIDSISISKRSLFAELRGVEGRITAKSSTQQPLYSVEYIFGDGRTRTVYSPAKQLYKVMPKVSGLTVLTFKKRNRLLEVVHVHA